MRFVSILILSVAALATSVLSAEPKGITIEDYDWWREARFGIFIHWNHSSLLELGAGSWNRKGQVDPKHASNKTDFDEPFVLTDDIRKKRTGRSGVPQEIYDNMFKVFNPSEFNAREWANTFKDAGAGYIVFTSKHHDGFCMFDTQVTDYNIMHTPFARDVAKELSDACAEVGIQVIWYYSVVDWYDPRFNVDDPKHFEDYLVRQIDELFGNYKNLRGIWWDGGGIAISQRVRLVIHDYHGDDPSQGPGIREFDIFEK